ncbi:MAG: alpha-2-macroglobulin family protein, partial [Bdellovibrionota bacterium]
GSVTLSFPLRAPKAVGDYAFKVTARSGEFSDGERRPFPVLPSRMHLAQSRFVSLHDKDSKTLEFADLSAKSDPTRINEQMVVTVDAQLFYGVLQALPYLERYPYECVEQTLNRFLSSGIVSSVFGKYPAVAKMAKQLSARDTQLERFDAADPNRGMQLEETPWLQEAEGGKTDPLANVLNPEIAKAERDEAIAKLAKMQLPEGAFPWFQGGQPDPHMTLYVLMSLARALEFKVDIPQDLVVKGWAYLHEWMDGNFQYMLSHDTGWEEVTMLNFALSGYPSPQWTGGAFDEAYRKKLLDFSFKHWKEHSPLVKGYLALTLNRMGRESDAKLVWDSVMDSAKFSDELGTYWAREDRSWLWYNDEIETHAFALRTQMELNPHDKRNEGMVQWLFLNKKLNHWKSTRATAEVIYSLTHYLDSTNGLGVPEEVRVDLGSQKTEFHFDPETYTGKKNQIVVSGPKVDSAARITVSKASKGFAFASATWAFSTDVLPAEDRGDFFQVSRRYFRRSQAGAEWTLTPLSEGAKIAVGDQIEVQLSLRTKHAAEYVHLRDPRGAGFEPESAVSSWKWDLGISWYEEVRDSGSNFFFSALPVGEYNFKYRLRANMAGTFRVGPATVQSMYAPEFNAYSAGNVLRVE